MRVLTFEEHLKSTFCKGTFKLKVVGATVY
jgi:hypothetical protein